MVTVEEAKKQCNIDHDWHDDDVILKDYINIATDFVKAETNHPEWTHIEDGFTKPEDDPTAAPVRVKGLILMVVADMYKNREFHISGALRSNTIYEYAMSSLQRYNGF